MWFPRTSLLALAALPLLLASCRINGGGSDSAYFRVEGDSSLTAYGRVVVLLCDPEDKVLDTLFDDSLASLDDLKALPAGSYHGGPARIKVLAYRGDTLAHAETRVYDGDTQKLVALVITPPDSLPQGPAPSDSQPAPGPTPPADPHGPALDSLSRDTVVSIKDSVDFVALVFDPDGDLAAYSLSCDGKTGDSTMISGYRTRIDAKHAFPDSGDHSCELKVWDRAGHSVRARRGARVEWDAPTVDAGKDTVVPVGGVIKLHAKGDDRFGPIVTREWKLNDGFWTVSPQQETQRTAPDEPGALTFILRVTDSDGLTSQDTLVVTIVPRS